MSSNEDNKALVRRFMEVFSAGDADGVGEMMDPEATWWVAGTIALSGTHKKDDFVALLKRVSQTCDGPLRLMPKAFTAEGNRVAVETESMAHLKNGRTYNNHYHFLFELRNGKVLRVKEYLDTMHTHEILCTP